MDSLVCSLEGRSFQGLLNGLSKKNFDEDELVTFEFLTEQLYTGMDLEHDEIIAQMRSFEKLLKTAAEQYWDPSRFEQVLDNSDIGPQHKRILVSFWMNEREKIHSKLMRASSWNDHLKQLSWRVDIKAASKQVSEINEPVAILEFGLERGHIRGKAQSAKVVRCELDRSGLADILSAIDDIQKHIDSAST